MTGILALDNSSKLLLWNTLITDPQEIPNGLVCTTGRDGGWPRFRFEDGTAILGRRQGQSTTVQCSQLNQNGHYVCFEGGREWPFYIYFNNGKASKNRKIFGNAMILSYANESNGCSALHFK